MLIAIFRQFFLLGCMSFGGPAAHLGYFKHHFVDSLRWLSISRYSQLISLSQALPGPGSSQVSFAIGVERAGATLKEYIDHEFETLDRSQRLGIYELRLT